MIRAKRLVVFIMSAIFAVSLFTSNATAAAAKIDPADATLKSLRVTGGVLSPAFSKNVTEYSVNVNSNITYVNVTATPSNARASFKFRINGDTTDEITGKSGKSTRINLEGLKTVIEVIVNPQAGTAKEIYTITVNRAVENDARLAKVALLPSGIGEVVFNEQGECTLNTLYTYSSIRIVPTAVDSRAKISVNKRVVKSGSQYSAALKTGENVFVINVTNGTGNETYKLTINRAKNNNFYLKTLSVSPGTMDKRFSKTEENYNLSIKDTDKKISIVPVAEDTNAKVELTAKLGETSVPAVQKGNKYEIGVEAPGTYKIEIKVTAEDGISNIVYRINVNKPDASDKTLSGIILSSGVLDKEFKPEITTYNVLVENSVSRITLEAKPANAGASVKMFADNKNVGSGKASIILKEDLNVIRIEVYSHDGSKEPGVYTVNIKRVPQPVMEITEVGYEDKTLPSNKISVRDNIYTIDLTGLKDTDMVKYVKVDVKYTTGIKFQNNMEISVTEGENTLNDLSAVGLTDTGEQGVSVGILKNNADSSGYITVPATLNGVYEGVKISKDIVLKARVKEARKENGINNIVNNMKLNLNNNTSVNASIDKSRNKLTFDFSKIDVNQTDLRVLNATINVKRDCTLEIGNRSVKLKSGDNILTIEDIGLVDNGNDGVSVEFLKKFGNISQSGTLTDETAKGSPEYVITFALKW